LKSTRATNKHQTQRIVYAIVAAVVGLALSSSFTTTTLAQNQGGGSPHFTSLTARIDGSGNLVCDAKEAGLGSATTVNIKCSADATALWACQNNGGNFPSDTNKQTSTSGVSASAPFKSGKNGQVTISLTVPKPTMPQPALQCGSGQHVVLVSISYSNIVVADTTNGVSISTPGPVSLVFFPNCRPCFT
jgi:hypothetical protein